MAAKTGGIAAILATSRTPAYAQAATQHWLSWIAVVLKPEGTLIIDAGAAKALSEGKSLLPAGVRQIDGRFERGDAVLVKDQSGREIARGLAAYGAGDAERIAGKRSLEIEAILGYRGRDEMIHRDDLALTGLVS
jgi:glutamate 5-kinase